MEALKSFKTWKPKKIALYAFIWILILYAWVFIYSLVFEQDKLVIDRYNFRQLEKVKPILESIPKNAKKFHTLKEFNDIYKTDVKPIKNCYYVSNENGKYPYIFWFKLESLSFRLVRWWSSGFDYLYPDPSLFTFSCSFGCVLVSGFESQMQRLLHFWEVYVYPDYDLGIEKTTCMGPVCPSDYMMFDWTISNAYRGD